MTNDLLPGDRYRGPLDLPRSEAVLASIAGGGAVVHFSVHQCTGFGAFAREQGACRQCQYIADIAATTRNRKPTTTRAGPDRRSQNHRPRRAAAVEL